MKRALSTIGILSFIVVTQIATVMIFTGGPISSADPPPACVEGDANGDFVLDVSDPIYLLEHLFLSGPAPVACASDPVPMTDRTASMGNTLASVSPDTTTNIDMPSPSLRDPKCQPLM